MDQPDGNSQRPVFYFDLGSPYSYLAAERIEELLPVAALWQPISLGALFKSNGRSSWSLTDKRGEGLAEVERRARAYGLPDICWPDPFPGHMLFALRVATYAGTVGKTRDFALAAFCAAFAEGMDLGDRAVVLEVARIAGLDTDAAEVAAADPAIKQELIDATELAAARNVIGVPTIFIGGKCFWGDDQLAAAAAAVG